MDEAIVRWAQDRWWVVVEGVDVTKDECCVPCAPDETATEEAG